MRAVARIMPTGALPIRGALGKFSQGHPSPLADPSSS